MDNKKNSGVTPSTDLFPADDEINHPPQKNRQLMVIAGLLLLLISVAILPYYLINKTDFLKRFGPLVSLKTTDNRNLGKTLEVWKTKDQLIKEGKFAPGRYVLEVGITIDQKSSTAPQINILNIKTGYPADLQTGGQYTLKVLDAQNNTLTQSSFFAQERIFLVPPPESYQSSQKQASPEAIVSAKPVSFVITFPLMAKASKIALTTRAGAIITTKNISEATHQDNPVDFQLLQTSSFFKKLGFFPIIQTVLADNSHQFSIPIISDGLISTPEMQQVVETIFKPYLLQLEPFKTRREQIQFAVIDNKQNLNCHQPNPVNQATWVACDYQAIGRIANTFPNNGYVVVYADKLVAPCGTSVLLASSLRIAMICRREINQWDNRGYVFAHELAHTLGGVLDEYVSATLPNQQSTHLVDNQPEKNCFRGSPPKEAVWPDSDPSQYRLGCSWGNWSRAVPESIMNRAHPKGLLFSPPAEKLINEALDRYAGQYLGPLINVCGNKTFNLIDLKQQLQKAGVKPPSDIEAIKKAYQDVACPTPTATPAPTPMITNTLNPVSTLTPIPTPTPALTPRPTGGLTLSPSPTSISSANSATQPTTRPAAVEPTGSAPTTIPTDTPTPLPTEKRYVVSIVINGRYVDLTNPQLSLHLADNQEEHGFFQIPVLITYSDDTNDSLVLNIEYKKNKRGACLYSEGETCHWGNCLKPNEGCSFNQNCGYVAGVSTGQAEDCGNRTNPTPAEPTASPQQPAQPPQKEVCSYDQWCPDGIHWQTCNGAVQIDGRCMYDSAITPACTQCPETPPAPGCPDDPFPYYWDENAGSCIWKHNGAWNGSECNYVFEKITPDRCGMQCPDREDITECRNGTIYWWTPATWKPACEWIPDVEETNRAHERGECLSE